MMKRRYVVALLSVFMLIFGGVLWVFATPDREGSDFGERVDGIPSTAQIRKAYEDAVAGRDEIPELLSLAFVAADDPDYFDTLPQKSIFTQGVVNMTFLLTAERSFTRHARLLATSLKVGSLLSREEILTWYMHEVYLGLGCYGVTDASLAYFGRPMDALGVGEAAFIGALPRAPSSFNPTTSYDRAIAQRNRVIEAMRQSGFITPEAAAEATETELVTVEPLVACRYRQ